MGATMRPSSVAGPPIPVEITEAFPRMVVVSAPAVRDLGRCFGVAKIVFCCSAVRRPMASPCCRASRAANWSFCVEITDAFLRLILLDRSLSGRLPFGSSFWRSDRFSV